MGNIFPIKKQIINNNLQKHSCFTQKIEVWPDKKGLA